MANEATQFTIGGVTHDVMDVGARQLIANLQNAINAITSGDTTTAIETFQEVINFLDGVTDDATLIGKLNELRTLINAKVDKETGKSLMTDAERTKLQNLPTNPVQSISVNGQAQTMNNGNVNIEVNASGLTKDDFSVETQGDGTVDINVADDTYKINMNHKHQGMVKLKKYTEATMPQTKDDDIIYVQVDDATNPQAIEALYIFGLEFTGGGAAPGTPVITSPSGSSINLGENDGTGVEGTIIVRGKYLTGDLTVSVAQNSGLSLSYGQLTGQSSVTVLKADAETAAGATVGIAYSGSGTLELADALSVTGGGASPKLIAVVVEQGLPVGYTRLQSISGITDFITTTINSAGTTWEFDVETYQDGNQTQILAGYGSGGAGQYGGACITGKWGLGTTDDVCTSVPYTTKSKVIMSFTTTQVEMTIGNETITRATLSASSGNLELLGFHITHTGDNFKIRGNIYSVKCTAGASFNGIPAERDSDNKQGIYDLANNVFYPLK